jgi:hypothetical protein
MLIVLPSGSNRLSPGCGVPVGSQLPGLRALLLTLPVHVLSVMMFSLFYTEAHFSAYAVIAAVHAQIIRSVGDRTKKLRFFGAALYADFRWKRHVEGRPRLRLWWLQSTSGSASCVSRIITPPPRRGNQFIGPLAVRPPGTTRRSTVIDLGQPHRRHLRVAHRNSAGVSPSKARSATQSAD